MARVRSIRLGEQNVRVHPSEVDCFFQTVESADGTKYLHLSTFGSDVRESEPKSSQSLQFDRAAASVLIRVVSSAFPDLISTAHE